jgi:S1-C subfamily serine protease
MTTLTDLSSALAEQVRAAAPSVAAIRLNDHRHLSATLWQSDVLIASAQSLPARDSYDIVLPGGSTTTAKQAGRDPGTNIAVLKLSDKLASEPANAWGDAKLGTLALALGADGEGSATARLGIVSHTGREWHSSAGGRIDARIALDTRLNRAEEGGPVVDANGARLGFTTFGPRRQVLVIPSATVERIVPQLLKDGRIARGWLGVALQPVAVPDALRASAEHTSGLMVMQLAENGPCAQAGVLAGDILLQVDGEPARPFRGIARRLGPDSIGRQVQLKLLRAGATLSLSATIAARPAA